jgi:hypothetical protein
MKILAICVLTILLAAISWGATVGIIYLITLCFGLEFSFLTATGVWLVLTLLSAFLKGSK